MGAPSTKRFTVRRSLGEGGMGIVYEAFDEERRTAVAMKALNRVDGDALARFKREFRAMQGLAHPNLVALDELFFEDGQWFFTMELLDGVDFVSHVRGSAPRVGYQSTVRETVAQLAGREAPKGDGHGDESLSFDEPKLRDGLRQLLEGLAALHAMDKVHRDIKPSNVMVTREGRVVLLDFGLVSDVAGGDRSTGNAVVGTPTYMAPEQAASRDVGPAADLYGVGVMLFELLTGRPPIEGAPLRVLLEKQTAEPRRPSSVAPGVPADLDALCEKLLRVEPERRPTAAEVLRALPVTERSGTVAMRSGVDASTFVGRGAELDRLRAAFAATQKGQPATVIVCGESGIGKSCMVRHFTAELIAERPNAMVLEGRCYERETVPYKTLDGIADALSRTLSRMPPATVSALLPVRCATLAQVFPAMLRVPQIAREHAALEASVEPHVLRQRAFVALRELFARVADRMGTVIAIDDLQWADDDGLRALAEILRPPDAPPLLLVGTVRVAPGSESAALERLSTTLPGDVSVIRLSNLGPDDARQLAVTLLDRASALGADPEVIASEAGGHPLFVEELARHVALGGSARDDVKLDGAIWSRVLQLDPPTREMAELVAVAGNPIPQQVLAAAAHVEATEFGRRTAALRVANIVRTGGARWADAIEPYHDRVREAVLAHLDPAAVAERHRALATAFEATGSGDAETLSRHWLGAGNRARALKYTLDAADAATAALAFDRAAKLYEEALALGAAAGEGARAVWEKLGDALANAGRAAPAAAAYQKGAEGATGARALDLQRRAADQLLRGGHFDEGVAAIRKVLAAIGIALPASLLAALFSFALRRLWLRVRGLGFKRREASEIAASELARVDICWSVAFGLGLTDSVRGAAFQSRNLLLALRAGEPYRVARATAFEITSVARSGGKTWRRVQALMERARSLAEASGEPHAVGWALLGGGMGCYLNGRFRQAIDLLDRASETFRTRCTGVAWELDSAQWFTTNSLAQLGALTRLTREVPRALRDALDRGDLYAAVNLRMGLSNLHWLVGDDPDEALTQIREAMGRWSKKGFHLEHFFELHGLSNIDLYAGRPREAYARVVERWSALRRSLVPLTIQSGRIHAWQFRGRSALAVAEDGGDSALAALALRDARAMEAEAMPWSTPMARLLRAGVEAFRGQDERAAALLRDAVVGFEAADMALYAAVARRSLGMLLGGAEGQSLVRGAEVWMTAEGVKSPARMTAMFAPGFAKRG